MSRFHGPQPGYKGAGRVKGIMRMWRKKKRDEAEARNKQYRAKIAKEQAETTS